jgi:lysophospholipase L1-like esterase
MLSASPTLTSNQPQPLVVTLLGDSTIDNRVWVGGVTKNFLLGLVGYGLDESKVKVQKSHRWFWKPKLSVVEHLMDAMPTCEFNDFTNDGFTTGDILTGNFKNKVFGNAFNIYPQEFFQPIIASEPSIKRSDFVILSIGGNDIREFLMRSVARNDSPQKMSNIKSDFEEVKETLKRNYVSILVKIYTANPQAKIILMTQYYPSMIQNNYKIMEHMRTLGEALWATPDAEIALHKIMRDIYTDIYISLQKSGVKNFLIADVTSSLNPYDANNHVSQIEPSASGGKKIARMLQFLLTYESTKVDTAYRFWPEFFMKESDDADLFRYVSTTPFSTWNIATLSDHKTNFTLGEQEVFNSIAGVDNNALAVSLERLANELPETSVLRDAAIDVSREARELLNNNIITNQNSKHWRMSVALTINLLKNPYNLNTIEYVRRNAENNPFGKGNAFVKFLSALAVLAGIAIFALCAFSFPIANATALITMAVCGALLSGGGGRYFFHNRDRGIPMAMHKLADVAERNVPRLA